MSLPPSRLTLPRTARALRLELKRNAVPYLLPLLAALFYFDTLRTADGLPPLWTQRSSVICDHMLFEFTVFAGGLGAWAGSREGRRKIVDLVVSTPRATWTRLSIALTGTLSWLLLAFLAGVAVVYIQTGLQATWGGPPLWPVFAGVAGVTVGTVIGFTAGVVFPGRFTPPLVAIGLLVLSLAGFRQALGVVQGGSGTTYALLSPDNSPAGIGAGLYYPIAPDLWIAQAMFMGGIAVALLGVLGLVSELRQLAWAGGRPSLRGLLARGGDWLPRAIAVILVASGVAASWTAFALAGTAIPDAAGGWDIPALHSAASDQPISATTDCTSGSGFQVCVHPAFSPYLADVAAALKPVGAEIAGLPGALTSAREVASASDGTPVRSGIPSDTSVFEFTAQRAGNLFGEFYGVADTATWRAGFQDALLVAFLEGPSGTAHPVPLGAARQAVADVLLTAVGAPPLDASSAETAVNGKLASGTLANIAVAWQRFGALPASARRAWLAAHLAALRAGQITLAQLP